MTAAFKLTEHHRQTLIRTAKYLVLIFVLTMHSAVADDEQPQVLELDFLLGSEPLASPQPTHLFAPTEKQFAPTNHFEGLLTLVSESGSSQIEILTDTFGIAADKTLRLRELPPYSFKYVMDGANIIPLERKPQITNHPNWEIIAEPGVAWDAPGEDGWSRAALPFTLKEKNENCLHNGMMTFLYKADGAITRVAWQVASETCLYVKINLWGVIDASFEPGSISSAEKVITAYRAEVANRLPVKPLSDLREDYPGLEPAAFDPPGLDDASVYGFVINGVNYRSECPTRFGPYPFCDVLDLPSYSLAKSVFGGLGYFILTNRWPEFASMPITELIPECDLEDRRWNDVTPAHLLNMTTGNYESTVFNADEDDASIVTFFEAETHAGKVRFSCEAWPHKSEPGSQWAYHTTDTYLLGVAMNRFLKQRLGMQYDIYDDIVYREVLKPLGLSPVTQWTHRTYDDISQPFTGFGLVFHNDDVLRIALALNSDSALSKLVAGAEFESAMFRSDDPRNSGLDPNDLAYSNGFWGVDVSQSINCPKPSWVPFFSGYGGIAVAMFPKGSIYYYFTDSNKHGFRSAAIEANKALNYCKE